LTKKKLKKIPNELLFPNIFNQLKENTVEPHCFALNGWENKRTSFHCDHSATFKYKESSQGDGLQDAFCSHQGSVAIQLYFLSCDRSVLTFNRK